MVADLGFDQATEPFHTVLVAGGHALPDSAPDVAITAWLRDRGVKAQRYGSICTGNGKVRLRALPSASAPVPSELASLIRARLIEAEEVHVERGNLDDVFRL